MTINPNLSHVASIMSDPSRAAILTALMDNRFHTAGELAYMARIKPQTTSFHISKLIETNLITVKIQGRHQYFKIQTQEAAQIMETLLTLAPPPQIRPLKQSSEDRQVRYARTCYNHPAGYLGVQITGSLIKKGFLIDNHDEFLLTDSGISFLSSLGVDIQEARKKRRSFCHKCLDYSERRYHMAGALGNALFDLFIDKNWVERLPKTRALSITSIGKKALLENFSIDLTIHT